MPRKKGELLRKLSLSALRTVLVAAFRFFTIQQVIAAVFHAEGKTIQIVFPSVEFASAPQV